MTQDVSIPTAQTEAPCAAKTQALPDAPSAGAMRARLIADLVIVVIFLAVIGLPLLDMLLPLDRTPNSENRNLTATPAAIKALGADGAMAERIGQAKQHAADLPRQFKAWTGDHFGFRNLMIRLHGKMKVNLLGVPSTPHVLLGKHEYDVAGNDLGQWLYYNRYGVVEHYRAHDLFTPEELEQWRRVIEQRRDWLAARGVRYLLVIAPNKHTIYPEFLPDHVNRVGDLSRTDQLVAYLRAHGSVEVADTRHALLAARKAGPEVRLYHRTDTHWNDLGAFRAYEPVAAALATMFPTVKPLTRDQFELREVRRAGGDLAGSLGVPDQFTETHLNLEPRPPMDTLIDRARYDDHTLRTQSPDGGPRLLMFRDSFGAALMPYLARHSRAATFIWTDQFEHEAVEREQPDVVITELIERLLMRKPPRLDPALGSPPE